MGLKVGLTLYNVIRLHSKPLKLPPRSYQQLSSHFYCMYSHLLLFCRQAEFRHSDGHTLTPHNNNILYLKRARVQSFYEDQVEEI